MNYIINTNPPRFRCGFALDVNNILLALKDTNLTLLDLPSHLFRSIDYKTTSAMIGCIFCENIARTTNGTAIVNPIEKGHPDVLPATAATASEELLRNYPEGLEVKCTVGNIPTGLVLAKANPRIDALSGLTWQAHHREVNELLGITFDFTSSVDGMHPFISGVFYSDNLTINDWGEISGISGRNTKVSAMQKSGREKMGRGWIAIIDDIRYIKKYSKILNFKI